MSQRAIWCEENLFHLKRRCKSSSPDVSYRSVRERGWEKRKDGPRSGVTSERATVDDLEIERAFKCVSNSVLCGTWLRQLFTSSVACLQTGQRNWVEFSCIFFLGGDPIKGESIDLNEGMPLPCVVHAVSSRASTVAS